jgi:hypothetical protein
VTASTAFEILPGEKARRHRGITVMPRLSCGVACYSDTYSMSQVSEMELRLLADQIVIPAILANPFVVFMSHQSDYARDHLAGFVFERAMTRLSQWTTLSYRNLSSEDIAKRYAKAFGVDVTP